MVQLSDERMNSVRELFSYETFYELYVKSKAQQERIEALEEASTSQTIAFERRMRELLETINQQRTELDALRNLIKAKQ